MNAQEKPYKGMAMEGFIATWYARNTGRDRRRFEAGARAVATRISPKDDVLEVAPGPGYLAIELAKRGYHVTGLDVSHTFVKIARENAAAANAAVGFHQGDAARMPFADASFDFVICMAAFKNFTRPLAAIDEMHRVLRAGGTAVIQDLRKDATMDAIDDEIRGMQLSRVNALLTRWTFRNMLLKSAYPKEALARMAAESRFGGGEITDQGIGVELRLTKSA
jgi:ubiquinone/menaquinone biosynthesis C-methylase UbiE